jgi:hypothetical protein
LAVPEKLIDLVVVPSGLDEFIGFVSASDPVEQIPQR